MIVETNLVQQFRFELFALFGVALGCAATVPETVYRADLEKQQSDYERRLRRLQEQKDEDTGACERIEVRTARQQADLRRNIGNLETALAEKQRIIESLAREAAVPRRQVDDAALPPRIRVALQKLGQGEPAGDKFELRFRVLADDFFDRGSSQLKRDAADRLKPLVETLKRFSTVRIRVEVAADAIGDADKGGWELTRNQGGVLLDVLVDLGLDPSRLSQVAYGRFRPVAKNDTEEGRRLNRRIEFVLTPLTSESFHDEESVKGQ